MKIKSKVKQREKLLIIAAVSICVLAAYALLRIKHKEDEIKLYREEFTRLQSEVSSGKKPLSAAHVLKEAQDALTGAEAALKQKQQELAAFTQNMVNVSSSDAVESVMLELTALAARHRVEVKQVEPFSGKLAGMPIPQQADAASLLNNRPMRKLLLNGHFADVQQFVRGLSDMPQTVQILNVAMRAGDTKANTLDSPKLEVEMVVLL